MSAVMLLGSALVAACEREPDRPFELAWIVPRLRAAGYQVSEPYPDSRARSVPGVVSAMCIDALQQPLGPDVLCVIDCPNRACQADAATRGMLGESYGVFYRGDTILIHRKCGLPEGGVDSQCAPVREPIFESDGRR